MAGVRKVVNVQAAEIFNRIDTYKRGYVHPSDLARWLSTEVQYNIS